MNMSLYVIHFENGSRSALERAESEDAAIQKTREHGLDHPVADVERVNGRKLTTNTLAIGGIVLFLVLDPFTSGTSLKSMTLAIFGSILLVNVGVRDLLGD